MTKAIVREAPRGQETDQQVVEHDGHRGGVPAIRSAAAILRFLHDRDNEPANMSQIARALELNGSTCFNLLKTLESERLLSYDSASKVYELGLDLVALASVVDNHGQVVEAALKRATGLVDEIGLTCLLARFTASEEFLVIEKVDSRAPIKVTVDVGTRFPANAAVMAKAYYAWQDEVVIDDMVIRHGLPAHSPNSITDPKKFKQELERVRANGYAVSFAEYWQDHNALASPIFNRNGQVSHILTFVAFAFQVTPDTAGTYGGRLRETAEQITQDIGGRYSPKGQVRRPRLPKRPPT